MGDSMAYEILPYEEVESLKKEYSFFSNRIEASKRKFALESKLRDAAQSLSRLNDPKARGQNGNMYGGEEQFGQTDEELASSTRKCEELAQEIWKYERKAQSLQKKLLEHTAGVLQMTHKGLKKNLKNNDQQRSSESVYGVEEFDDRSLYKSADYLDDYGGGYSRRGENGVGSMPIELKAIQETEKKLEDLNSRMREMILQVNPNQYLDPIPQPTSNGEAPVNHTATLQAHLAYLENSLNAMDYNQAQGSDGSVYDAEERLAEINSKLRDILKDSASPQSQSPALTPPPGTSGRLQAQLGYLSIGIDNFKRRAESLTEQKGILKTQIQQQRELNSKSDAQRDDHILELSQEIERLKKELDLSEREGQGTRDELSLVMEQLDASRQGAMLEEQGRSVNEADREALRQAEENSRAKDNEILRLEAEKEALQQAESNARSQDGEISRLEASILQLRTEADQEIKKAIEARQRVEEEVKKLQAELSDVESKAIRAQIELTIAQAELDGAYGSRAERAAAVAANPAVRQELDQLNERNASLVEQNAALMAAQGNRSAPGGSSELQGRVQTLEKELRETIEDYEVMTKASIEFEKKKNKLENVIDELRDRCENLESQLNDDKIQWLGMNGPPSGGRDAMPPDTTSTTVLKNEFKRMMRDTRAENMKALKVRNSIILLLC